MAKSKKLPSGSWNIRAYSHKDENGKAVYVSFTAPTKAECEYMAATWKKERKNHKDNTQGRTVRDAVEKYIDTSEPVLSPITIHNYRQYMKNGFQSLLDTPLHLLTLDVVQAAINEESKRKSNNKSTTISPKMVKNEWSVIASALKYEGYVFAVRLPKVQRNVKHIPEPLDVLRAIYGTEVELPCMLAMGCSLRLSEIRGLRCSNIHDGCLFVEQVKVYTAGRDYVKPLAKTAASKRAVILEDDVAAIIEKSPAMKKYRATGIDGYLVPMPDSTIRHLVYKYMIRAGLDLSIHDLRHEFASIDLVKLQTPKKVAQTDGGWSTAQTMDNIYNHAFNAERLQAAQKRNEYIAEMYTKIKGECVTT